MEKKQTGLRFIAHAGLTAAAYVVITTVFMPVSFGAVQFRFAEALNLLAFISPVYAVGVTLGCFLSNMLFSEFGIADIIIGTVCTGLATFCITKTKSLFIASLWPSVFTLPVSLMITYFIAGNAPFLPAFLTTAATVMIGEFAVVTALGYPLFRYAVINNKALLYFMNGG